MSEIAITTSQNVNIQFRLASIGERIFAFLIDLLVLLAYVISINYLLFRVLGMRGLLDQLDRFSYMALMSIVFFPVLIYALVAESFMEGQTFGKKAVGIKTVKIDGYQCSFADYLIRWIFRGPEIFMLFGIPALLSTLISNQNQRLGDMAAGTAVISLKSKVGISHTILENLKDNYVPLFSGVIALTDNDVRIIKENYVRSVKSSDHKMLHRLVLKIQEVLKLSVEDRQGLTERQFVDKIIKDYNFYTGREV